MARAKNSCDFDKQFIEDLETAQALSLETLALERFRLEKEKQVADRKKYDCEASGSTFPKIRPPPAVQRRNSVTTQSGSSSTCSGSDLISFKAPKSSLKYNTLGDMSVPVSNSSNANLSSACYSHINFGKQSVGRNVRSGDHVASFNSLYLSKLVVDLPKKDDLSLTACLTSKSNTIKYNKPDVVNYATVHKKHLSNLIDLNEPSSSGARKENVRVSLLEAFDPLMSRSDEQSTNEDSGLIDADQQSIYDPYDPFDYYYYPPSHSSHNSDLVYSAVMHVTDSSASSPPLQWPKGKDTSSSEIKRTCSISLSQNIKPVNHSVDSVQDPDLKEFILVVKKLRGEYLFSDGSSNVGLFMSPTIDNFYITETSIKIIVYPLFRDEAISFTCDVSASVEHVIFHAASELEVQDVDNYILKVYGYEEYFDSRFCLKDYDYVHQCIKLEKDVLFNLVCLNSLDRHLARDEEDDKSCESISLENILPNDLTHPISYDTILILLETVDSEISKVRHTYEEFVANPRDRSHVKSQSVVQSVKAICSLLGNIVTVEISTALEGFCKSCESLPSKVCGLPEIVRDEGDYSVIEISSMSESFEDHCNNIRYSIQNLIEMYIRLFRVGFNIINSQKKFNCIWPSTDVIDTLRVYIDAIHRVPQKWNHSQFLIKAQIYYGTRPIGQPVASKAISCTDNFQRAVFNTWLPFEGLKISSLSRECRIVLELYGQITVENKIQLDDLGWTAIQLFDFNRCLIQGSYLLSLWPPESNKKLGPAPPYCVPPANVALPVIGVVLPDFGGDVVFPSIKLEQDNLAWDSYDFESLDENTQHQLLEILEQDTFSNPVVEDREILWEKRHYLLKQPQALPKVLLAAHSWDPSCLPDLYSLLNSWSPMNAVDAFQLLLPCFPDCEVRRISLKWIDELHTDLLIDYLPQLIQAYKHETYETSPLSELLLRRSLSSPRFAHSLYWLLIQSLPGQSPQNSSILDGDFVIYDFRYYKRMQLLLRSLLAISGESVKRLFMSQQLLAKGLLEAAELVKSMKESLRLGCLYNYMENLHSSLASSPTCLPTNPSAIVNGINVKQCSYFTSNTLPLKVCFTNKENINITAIFKVGDDLTQDMMSMQMIRFMDKIWLKEGLDLKIVTFTCIPTGHRQGIIEMINDSETLRKIQVEFGLTGSFKDRPIAEWLAKHNPSALDYERAVSNFTASCAGYCVATYILGICDRHNDNIMLKTTGHIFHIDFGKFLGDAQMIGNFKRDRTPFVLTSDMAYVINGGDKPSVKFHHFVDLCCQAFNIVRQHGNDILNLFGLLASSGVGGLNVESVKYVQNALLPHLSNAEAAATFARMIQSALKSWLTQFNFFLHNLAQLRFSLDQESDQLLSFVSKTYSMPQEGRIVEVEVFGCQKRYDPEKYYLYILRVRRLNHPDPMFIFRSYKEFCEFHQKLCLLFPLAKCHSLHNPGLKVGRSNIKQVAEKRMVDVQKFLDSLFNMADEICHSDLVYTFFHPILRDQQDSSVHESKLKDKRKERGNHGSSHLIKGEIKLTIHYIRETFRVMVHHVRDLPYVTGYQEPSTYVKVYLLPDHSKATKRKTKVVKKNCHPSFMEMLEYRLPLEKVQNKLLQATVWCHDPLQENEFLGGATINLSEYNILTEITDWYPLRNVHR